MDSDSATTSRTRWSRRFFVPVPAGPHRFAWRASDIAAAVRDSFESELQERAGFQWLAVAFGTGAALYFVLPREPLLIALLAGALAFTGLGVFGYRRGTSWRYVMVLGILFAGGLAGKLRVDGLQGAEVVRATFAHLSGRVVATESRAELRPRVVLDSIASDAFVAGAQPPRLRVTLAQKYGLPPLGSRIALNARIMPIGGAAVPGGYDPHRAAFFEAIGGGGFALGAWTLQQQAPAASLDLAIGRLRAAIVQRIMAAQPGEAGAVASALLVGERSALSSGTNDSLRISGLFHILSISGLHMMLVAGTTFLLVRALFALSPSLALQRPIRKWAAAVSLAVLTAYFALSGGGAATLRSYVMAAIMVGAVLVDRPAISMRNLAIGAFIVLALEPEGVLEPGFQMSFAAVAALTAAWEAWRRRETRRLATDDVIPGLPVLRTVGNWFLGVAITTLVAGSATGIFAAYHFERVASYSLLGNLLAAPLVSFIIMPFGLLSLVAMPFGLESLPLAVMAQGIRMLLGVSRFVASLPGAELRAPPIAAVSLLLVVLGLLWLCLWRRSWRLAGVPTILLGLVSIPFLADPPDLLIAPETAAVAARDPTGTLRVAGAKAGSYIVEQFFDEEGGAPKDGATLTEGVSCDPAACLLTARNGSLVSRIVDPVAFAEDCGRAAIVATPLEAPADCRAALVIDAKRLAAFGAHAVWLGKGGAGPAFRVVTDRSAIPRPWQRGAAR